MVKPWDQPQEKEERVLGEGGVLSDEDIAALQPDADKAQADYNDYKTDKIKKNIATREDLISHAKRIFDLEIDVGERILVFKVRRMTEKERTEYNKINFAKLSASFEELTPEQFNEIKEQGYIMMAEVIVEPKMTVAEWKETVDVALLDKLSNEVSKLSTQVNDVLLIEEFKKK